MKNSHLTSLVILFILTAVFMSIGCICAFAEEQPVFEMGDGGLMVEAEDLVLNNYNIAFEDPDASGGYATMGTADSVAPEIAGTPPAFSIKMNIKTNGDYLVYFRLKLTKGTGGTCRMGLGNAKTHYNITASTEYQWIPMAGYKLTTGTQTLNYYWRNSRVIVDKIIITNNACVPPTGLGEMPEKFSLDDVNVNYDKLLYPLPPVVPKMEHPRLFVTKDKIPQVKANLTHKQNIDVYNKLLKAAANNYDCLLDQKNISNNTNYNYLEYIDANAFLYLINGDQEAGKKAVDGIYNYMRTLNVSEGTAADRDGACAIFVAACVYDWCHNIIPKEVKEEIINLAFLNATRTEFRWPPVQMNAYNSDHGDEFGLMKNLFAFTIAIYDDYEEPYNMVAGRLFSEYVPSRNAKFEENIYNTQGDDYGAGVRGNADFFFRLMLDQLGCADMISINQHENAYQQIFRRLPSGVSMQDSDIYTATTGGHGTIPSPLFIGANLFKDPYLKGELFSTDTGKGLSGMGDRLISSALWLLLNDVNVGTLPREQLPLSIYTGDASGIMVARSSWDDGFDSDSFVVSMKTPEKYFGGHGHKDAGHFYVYYKGPLAIDSGIYQSEPFVDQAGNIVTSNLGVSSDHNRNYAQTTIAHNSMLIYDPDQKVVTVKGEERANSGSQEVLKVNVNNLDTLQNGITRGEVIGKDMGRDLNKPDFTYLSGDLAGHYGYRAEEFTRSFMYYNFFDNVYPGALIVFDRVTSSDPNFKKTWLLHSQHEPVVEGTRTTVRYDDSGYNGRMINDTLLPLSDNAEITKIGGPGKEFLVGDWNYMAIPSNKLRDESGKWRIELSPKQAAKTDYFLNVIQVGDSTADPEPLDAKLLETDKFYGVKIKDRVAFFSKTKTKHTGKFNISIDGAKDEKVKIAICDLSDGLWNVEKDGKVVASEYVTADGTVLYFDGECGEYTITKTRQYVKPYNKDLSILARVDTSIQAKTKFKHNSVIYSSVLPVKLDNEIYIPLKKEISLIDDLAVPQVDYDTMTVTVYDDPQTRTAVLKADSPEFTLTADGETKTLPLTSPVKIIDGEFYINYKDLPAVFDVTVAYGALGDVVRVTSTFQRVDNSKNIVNLDDPTRVRIKDLKASSYETSNYPYNAVDNNAATGFTNEGTDEWLIIELEEASDIKDIAIIWNNRSTRQAKFSIEVSADGETYTELFNGMSEVITGDKTSFEMFNAKSENVKFIRLGLFGNTTNKKNTINEMYITKQ